MNIKAYMRGIGAGMIVAALVMGVPQPPKETHSEPIDKTTLVTPIPSASVSKETEVSASDKKENLASDSKETTTSSVKTDDKNTTSAGTSTSTSTGTSVSKETEASVSKETETSTSTSASVSTSTSVSASTSTSTSTSAGTSTSTATSTSTSTSTGTSTSTSASVSTINPLPEGETGFTNKEGSVEIKVIKGDSSVSVSRRMFEAGLVESAVEFDKFLCSNGYDHSISVGTYEIEYGLDFETMAKIITRRQ